MAKKQKKQELGNGQTVTISKPNMVVARFKIVGTSPYVQHKFSKKAKEAMKKKQTEGGLSNKSKKRTPRDYKQDYKEAQYEPMASNWPNGAIPATAIRAAMISACRLVDFKMTDGKQCVFVVAEDYDIDEGIPLIRITKGKPKMFEQALRVANGNPDIRIRPMWSTGWEAIVRIRYDADRFTLTDTANLLLRAGIQVGIGEGRNASRMCVGVGWGCFEIAADE
jgi:hypothetical protein